jgi:hypothetical protein
MGWIAGVIMLMEVASVFLFTIWKEFWAHEDSYVRIEFSRSLSKCRKSRRVKLMSILRVHGIQVEVLTVVTLCKFVVGYHSSEGLCCLHLLDKHWRWRQNGSPKHQYMSSRPTSPRPVSSTPWEPQISHEYVEIYIISPIRDQDMFSLNNNLTFMLLHIKIIRYGYVMVGCCEHGNEPSGSIKGGGISWQAEWLSASQEGLCSMELVISLGYDLSEKHTASQLQRSVGLCLEGTSEHGNETSGSIKGGEFLD